MNTYFTSFPTSRWERKTKKVQSNANLFPNRVWEQDERDDAIGNFGGISDTIRTRADE